MNGTAMVWQTLQSDDKRSYYWNKETNTTSWVKPDELLTPAQRATGYAETSAAGGRTYWYRKDDKSVTTWEAPPGWFESAPQASAPEEPNQFVTSSFPTYGEQRSLQGPRDEYRPRHDKPSYDRQNEGFRGAMAVLSSGPEYATEAEAETAFFKLLRKAGVQTDWTWEQTMRATIQDPQFRALKDPSERKLAFEKFVDELKVQEREKEKERALKLRQDFRAMLNSHHEIKYYTRWKTALPMIEGEAVFRSTKDEDEKKRLFAEYIMDLKKAHEEHERNDHEAAMLGLQEILRDINLTAETHWADAQDKIFNHEAYVNDEKYKTLSKSDVLSTFANSMHALEHEMNAIKQREKKMEIRRKRKAREGFQDLLRELQEKDILKPDSMWKEIFPYVENEPRFIALLENGNEQQDDGSGPLEFFFDAIDDMERDLYEIRKDAEDVLLDHRFKVRPQTSIDEFMAVVQDDKRTASLKRSQLEAVFKRLHKVALDREEDAEREAKRQQRKAVDALRSCIRHLKPPVDVGDTWEEVRPRIENTEEYKLVDSDEDRHLAFDKHMNRLKEDAERDRARRADRERREDRHAGRRDRRRSRSRTVDMDPYEADRRKHTAERERHYRQASHGLSPPPRDRRARDDRYERDDRDRRERQVSLSVYDRERREREAERERSYITRADPRAKPSELDYGDSSDGPSRPESSLGKRADSDRGHERRPAKRPRTDRGGERPFSRDGKSETPAAAPADKEMHDEPALQSGSEEGEIEEV